MLGNYINSIKQQKLKSEIVGSANALKSLRQVLSWDKNLCVKQLM